MQIVGYVEVDGVRTFSDRTMNAIYETLVKERTLDIVFSDDRIETFPQFLEVMKNPVNIVSLILIEGEIVGVAWLNQAHKNHAFVHYALFKKVWGIHTLQIADACLNYWFSFTGADGQLMIDVLLGQTPEWNRRAINYTKRLGWTVLGTVPLIANGHGLIISYLTREQYYEQKRRQQRSGT